MQWAQYLHAKQVVLTDVDSHLLKIAKTFGIKNVVNMTKQNIQDLHQEFDVAIEASGNDKALMDITNVIRFGGNLVLIGMLSSKTIIDGTSIIRKGLHIKSVHGRQMFSTWEKMLAQKKGCKIILKWD